MKLYYAETLNPRKACVVARHLRLLGWGEPDAAATQAATEQFKAAAQVLEAHLAQYPRLVGNSWTVADFATAITLP